MSSHPTLIVEDLTISLPQGGDRPHAVEHISFTIYPGKVVCLLGESGSGKSIIASTVMGLLPEGLSPVGGKVLLAGDNILNLDEQALRKIRGAKASMVFQEPMTALNPVLTCGEQVEETLLQHTTLNKKERHDKIIALFERVKLPDPERIFNSYPHQLSGGQRQRIVISMALILRPQLLICDEPTTALDVTTQKEILKLIKDLQVETQTAVLFITHDFGVVAEIADEVVVLQLGKMIEQGDKQKVLATPAQPYTQMLLNAVPELKPNNRPDIINAYPLLEANKVQKTYISKRWPFKNKEVKAVKTISLKLRAGETISIVGESGSGKSTFARCIAKLIDPTDGDIFANGMSVSQLQGKDLFPFRKYVQIVFQDPYRSLNPRQTVGDSIIEGPVNFGVSREEAWRNAEELMHLVRMKPDALYRYPSEFSGGQRQRISIARALACNPKVLICDEAVSALDVSVQAQILDLLEDIQRRLNIGILFITHDLRVASRISDYVIVLRQGQIEEEGKINQVFQSPQSTYTQELMHAAPGQHFEFHRSRPETELIPA